MTWARSTAIAYSVERFERFYNTSNAVQLYAIWLCPVLCMCAPARVVAWVLRALSAFGFDIVMIPAAPSVLDLML